MTIEIWLALGAAAMLAAASIVRVWALRTGSERQNLVAWGARLAAAAILFASLILASAPRGGWSAFDLQQVALGLALAVTVIHLALNWRPADRGGNPLADVMVLLILLITALAIQPGVPPADCIHHTSMIQAQWIIHLLGSSAIITAGCAGLMLALAAALAGRGWVLPPRVNLHAQIKEPTAAGLILLGAGIVLNAGWSWRAMGSLTSGDPRETWMIVIWLLAAMSLQAWQLGGKAARWAAGLAIAATAAVLFALLALPDLSRLLGI